MRKIAGLLILMLVSYIGYGQVDVVANSSTTTYANIKLAFDAVNTGTHTGAITINITGTTSDPALPAVLNSTGIGSASYTSILIQPTVDGALIRGATATGRGVIELNGADNVTINGDNPNTAGTNRNLTVQNTAGATITYTSVIRVMSTNVAEYNTNGGLTFQNLILTGNVTGGNSSSIINTTSASNASFGVIVGPNGGATPTAISSVTSVMSTTSPVPTVNNFTVQNCAINAVARGIYFGGGATSSSNIVTLANNTIGSGTSSTTFPMSTSTTVYTKGIIVQGMDSVAITGNNLVNIGSYVGTAVTAIELTSLMRSALVASNQVSGVFMNSGNFAARGITMTGPTAQFIVRSNVVNNIQNTTGSSSSRPNALYIATSASTGLVERNRFSTVYNRNNTTYGSTGVALAGGNNIVFQNNFVYDVNQDNTGTGAFSTSFGTFGVLISSGTGHKIYHNSIWLSGNVLGTPGSSSDVLIAALGITSTSYTGIDVRSNIFGNTMTGANASSAYVGIFLPTSGTSSMNLTLNNNAFYTNTSANAGMYHAGTTYTSPVTTQGVGLYTSANFNSGTTSGVTNARNYTAILSSAGTNDNSTFNLSSSPFTSSTDLHINSGTTPTRLESGGATGTAVTVDIDGDTRPGPANSQNGGGQANDIGADEFDGVPAVTCVAPTAVPTSLTFTGVTATTVNGNFTAASPAPSGGYLVIRTTANTLAATPVDGTAYLVGANATFGTGGAVVSSGSSISFTSTGLTAGTTYYYWIFSFNDGSCLNGPKYNASSLNGQITTGAVFTSIASGTWQDGSTWNQGGAVPSATSEVTVAAGHTVTVNGADANAGYVTTAATGTLTVSSNTLTIGGGATTGLTNAGTVTINGGTLTLGANGFNNRTFANTGALNVSNGTLNIFGNFSSSLGSTFAQSGGDINIDGNNGGSVTNSVASGTAIMLLNQLNTGIQLTGGTLTIIDPHAAAIATKTFSYSNATAGSQSTNANHTIRFGDGTSTDPGGNIVGFEVDVWASTAYLSFGNIIINGPAGTNRIVTPTYNFSSVGNFTVNDGGQLVNTYAATLSMIVGGNLNINNGGKFSTVGGLTTGLVTANTSTGLTIGSVTNAQTINVGSTGILANAATGATANINNLTINNTSTAGVTFAAGLTPTVSGTTTITVGKLNADAVSLTGTAAQTVSVTAATSQLNVGNLTLNNSTGATLSGSGFVNVTGAYTGTSGTLTAGGRLVLKSTAAGTARYASGTISGNVIAERYLTAKTKGGTEAYKSLFLASPVTAVIATAGWQQQIHITGAGTGGTVCGTGSAAFNSNGFDKTATDNPSMFTYSQLPVNSSRWTSIASTNATSLTPGVGYRVAVRGPRTVGCDLINGSAQTSVQAVTLSATGMLTQGNVGIPALATGGTADLFQLVGNPYASSLSFTALKTNAGSNIEGTYWTYNPANIAGSYSSYNDQTTTNFPGGYDATVIASGQAFFIKRTAGNTGALATFFQEGQKTATAQTGLFRGTNSSSGSANWQKLIRVGLYTSNTDDTSRLDETVVRFAQSGVQKDVEGALDAQQITHGAQSIAALKAGVWQAIQTRPVPTMAGDTVKLNLTSNVTGQYLLGITEQIDMTGIDVILRDKFLGIQQPIVLNQPLAIDVTSNTASQGDNRFELIFRSSATLAAKFISVSGERTADKATVKFTAQEDGNVKTFAVERSQDGSRFETVTSLKGSDRAGQFSYVAEDGSVNSSVVYYRIKANNANGTADYSQVIKLSSKAAISMTMSPNPAKDVVTLKAEGLSGKASIRFTDASGRVVLSQPLTITGSGTQQVSVSSLAQGIYQVLVVSESGETLSTQKLIKQ